MSPLHDVAAPVRWRLRLPTLALALVAAIALTSGIALGVSLFVTELVQSTLSRCIDNGSLSFCSANRILVFTVPSG